MWLFVRLKLKSICHSCLRGACVSLCVPLRVCVCALTRCCVFVCVCVCVCVYSDSRPADIVLDPAIKPQVATLVRPCSYESFVRGACVGAYFMWPQALFNGFLPPVLSLIWSL